MIDHLSIVPVEDLLVVTLVVQYNPHSMLGTSHNLFCALHWIASNFWMFLKPRKLLKIHRGSRDPRGIVRESYGFDGFSGIPKDSHWVRGSISGAEMDLKSPAALPSLRDQSLGCWRQWWPSFPRTCRCIPTERQQASTQLAGPERGGRQATKAPFPSQSLLWEHPSRNRGENLVKGHIMKL